MYFLMIVFTSFTTCKKDKTFGEKYPELVGEWEWESAIHITFTGGLGGAGGGYNYDIFTKEKDRDVIPLHSLKITKNGLYWFYTNGRLLESGYINGIEFIGFQPMMTGDSNLLDYRLTFQTTKKRNTFINQQNTSVLLIKSNKLNLIFYCNKIDSLDFEDKMYDEIKVRYIKK